MSTRRPNIHVETVPGEICRGTVFRCLSDGLIDVDLESGTRIKCRLLETSPEPPALASGDTVLIWQPAAGESGVVMGRVSVAPVAPPRRKVPDELVLEAKKGLVLRVGDGSITIRADGKILIKGTDLVSHAKRTNRIKGGSVSLN